MTVKSKGIRIGLLILGAVRLLTLSGCGKAQVDAHPRRKRLLRPR